MIYTCSKCGDTNKLADEMIFSPLPSWCKECYRKYKSKYSRGNGNKTWHRNKNFKYKYGITIEQYEEILQNQNNCCAICKREFDEQIKSDVDHCHKEKFVRGILCHSCNLALGYFKDSIEILASAISYLAKSVSPKQTDQTFKGEENVATVQ